MSPVENGPAFNEPWHIQAYALAQVLQATGRIAPEDWTRTFAEELRKAAASGAPDDADSYAAALVQALTRIVEGEGLIDEPAIRTRQEAWRRAYLTTPHGNPVRLAD